METDELVQPTESEDEEQRGTSLTHLCTCSNFLVGEEIMFDDLLKLYSGDLQLVAAVKHSIQTGPACVTRHMTLLP